jgi:arsenite methyltransferase
MCPASTDATAPSPPDMPPDLSQHFERIVTDRHLKAGRDLARAMALPRGCSVLDLGCGTGFFSEQLAAHVGMHGDVLGLDPSPYHISIAHQRAKPNLRFQVGSPFQLARFPQGCFGAIVVNGLLHNWPDPGPLLKELLRVLKPGGKLGLATHSKAHPHPVVVVQRAVLAREPYAAFALPDEARDHAVDAAGLQALLLEAGFAALEVIRQPDENVHATVNAAIEFAQATAWGQLLRHLPDKPDDLRARARADIAAGLERLRTAQGICHKGERLLAVATKAD